MFHLDHLLQPKRRQQLNLSRQSKQNALFASKIRYARHLYHLEFVFRIFISSLLCLCFGLGLGLSLAYASPVQAQVLSAQQPAAIPPSTAYGVNQGVPQGMTQGVPQGMLVANTGAQQGYGGAPYGSTSYGSTSYGNAPLYSETQGLHGTPNTALYSQTLTQDNSTQELFPLAVNLDATDLALLKELAKNQNSKSAQLKSKPFVAKPGEVSFIFGASQPTVVCSLLRVCDIALEPGENVVDIKVGDSARWIIERSASGSPQGIIEHITLKPTDTNLQSNLRIYTDRRSYSIDLKSSSQDFMPSVKFVYPEQTLAKYAQVKAQLQQQQAYLERNTVHMGQQALPLTSLNFNYDIDGDKSIKPLRVFNDQRKTYIQMSPQLMRQNRLPALVAVHDSGSWFTDAKTAMINYRIIDNNFVVDGIPPHLRLILGQHSDQAASVDIKLQLD